MGSDLSKPKNRKHHKNDCPEAAANNAKRNSRTICYDLPDCYDPCSQAVKFAPIQLPPMPRQQPRYPRDNCRDPCRNIYKDFDNDFYDRSAIVSNLQLSPRTPTRKLVCYECPEKNGSISSSRSPRYKTTKPSLKREDTFLDDCDYKQEARQEARKEERRYTVVNSSTPPYYSDNKNNKLSDDFDGIPKDRIYEIRKEKILIKADKSPERYRSKSSEKYLDNKDYKHYDDGQGTYKVYERDDSNNNNGIRKQLQSRSVYVLKDDRESSPERQTYADHKQYNKSKNNNSSNNSNSVNAPSISTVGNSDIVYVPMVKEDFIKRECQKLENINNTQEQSIKNTFSPKTERQQQNKITNPINSILTNSRTTTTATSPFSPMSRPKNFKKVIISESFPHQQQKNDNSLSIPINFENNLLKIKINQPDSKSTTPYSSNCSTPGLPVTAEFRPPNLIVRKNNPNNSIAIGASNLIDQIRINLNNSNNKQGGGLVYSRYIYSNAENKQSEYENINDIMPNQKLRESSLHLNDIIVNKDPLLVTDNQITGFHRF